MKYHYPLEYIKSVLNHTSYEKIPGLVMDLRDIGIKIHTPNINCSKQGFHILDGELWFGLGSIKGIGEAGVSIVEERKKNGVFQSMPDFVLRIQPSKNILERLICSGAMDGFCEDRKAMIETVPEYVMLLKKMKRYEKKLEEAEKKGRRGDCWQKYLDIAEKIRGIKPDTDICEDQWERLLIERSLLGVFVSRHPITLFPSAREYGAVEIGRLQKCYGNQNVTVIGIVSDFRKCRRKRDGAEMAFFKLSDSTGGIEVCCFADAYNQVKEHLRENIAIKVSGKILYDKCDETRKISLWKAETLKTKDKAITIYTKLYLSGVDTENGELWNLLKPYVSRQGNPLRLYDILMDEFRETDLLLSPTILRDERVRASLHKF